MIQTQFKDYYAHEPSCLRSHLLSAGNGLTQSCKTWTQNVYIIISAISILHFSNTINMVANLGGGGNFSHLKNSKKTWRSLFPFTATYHLHLLASIHVGITSQSWIITFVKISHSLKPSATLSNNPIRTLHFVELIKIVKVIRSQQNDISAVDLAVMSETSGICLTNCILCSPFTEHFLQRVRDECDLRDIFICSCLWGYWIVEFVKKNFHFS